MSDGRKRAWFDLHPVPWTIVTFCPFGFFFSFAPVPPIGQWTRVILPGVPPPIPLTPPMTPQPPIQVSCCGRYQVKTISFASLSLLPFPRFGEIFYRGPSVPPGFLLFLLPPFMPTVGGYSSPVKSFRLPPLCITPSYSLFHPLLRCFTTCIRSVTFQRPPLLLASSLCPNPRFGFSFDRTDPFFFYWPNDSAGTIILSVGALRRFTPVLFPPFPEVSLSKPMSLRVTIF